MSDNFFRVNKGIKLNPSAEPITPTEGQIYLDEADNKTKIVETVQIIDQSGTGSIEINPTPTPEPSIIINAVTISSDDNAIIYSSNANNSPFSGGNHLFYVNNESVLNVGYSGIEISAPSVGGATTLVWKYNSASGPTISTVSLLPQYDPATEQAICEIRIPTSVTDDVLVGRTTQDTLINKTISGSSNTISNIGNSSLTNSSITINGSSVSLGGSTTITANTPNNLTVGTGLNYDSGTTFNGSAAKTISVDTNTIATKNYVDTNFVQLVGDTMSGNLLMGTAGPGEILTLNTGGISSNQSISILTENSASDSGSIVLNTGFAENVAGYIEIETGSSNNDPSGDIYIYSGYANYANSGEVWLASGDSLVSSGAIKIFSGLANSTSGTIEIYTGDNGTFSGDINLTTGSPSILANRGSVNLDGKTINFAAGGSTVAYVLSTGIELASTKYLKIPDLTANRVLVSDSQSIVSSSNISTTTLNYLDVTSSIQDQLDELNRFKLNANDMQYSVRITMGSSTLSGINGMTTASSGTIALANFNSASTIGKIPHVTLSTTSTAGSTTGIRGATSYFAIGGGFKFSHIFMINDASTVSGARQFCGMNNTSTATAINGSTNTNPLVNSLTNFFCFGYDGAAGDANFFIFHNGPTAGSTTKITLNNNYSIIPNADIFKVDFVNFPGSSDLHYEITGLISGLTERGTISSNLPSVQMYGHSERFNGTSAASARFEAASINMYTAG